MDVKTRNRKVHMTATLRRRAEQNIGGGGVGAPTGIFRRRRHGKIFGGGGGGATGLDLYVSGGISPGRCGRGPRVGRASRSLRTEVSISSSARPQFERPLNVRVPVIGYTEITASGHGCGRTAKNAARRHCFRSQ
jgi:hypothetical protein